MYALLLALLLLVPALPVLAQTPKPAPTEATEPVIKQLEAFRQARPGPGLSPSPPRDRVKYPPLPSGERAG